MIRYATVEEWRSEAAKRFGDNRENWAFICPECGRIATVAEMKRAGGTANDAPQECVCLHRLDAGSCSCRSYRSPGTMGKGALIGGNNGDPIEVFDFAPEGVHNAAIPE